MTGNWKSIKRLPKNPLGRDFVCGDIHGCFEDMEAELKRINFSKKWDRLFCVGDLIDRGPQSELATYYMDYAHWFFPVMGNHENMFLMGQLDFPWHERYIKDHIRNGGEWAYKMDKEKFIALRKAIDDLPLIIQVDDTIIVHAALPAVESLEDIEKNPTIYLETALWHREAYPPILIPGINRVFVGHSIVNEPTQYGKIINIDTGVCRKYRGSKEGKLTIMEMGRT